MAIDYSAFHFAKGTPAKLEKQGRDREREARDVEESAKVKVRSGGRCEVVWFGKVARKLQRCSKRATQVHHMVGGWGKRARGLSIRAEHKQHVCADHHSLITSHVLRRVGGEVPRWDDEYEHVGK